MRLLVLAGGFGTRLQASVGDVPKALAPIGHVPFLRLQILHWISQDVQKYCFLLHHKAAIIADFLASAQTGLLKGCDIDWIIEPEPMDTGGAIAYAIREKKMKGDFLVANADTWIGTGIGELIKSESPSLAVVRLPDISRYGQVEFNENLYVCRFAEKANKHISGWINAGIARLDSDLFVDWNGQPFSLERALLPKLVASQRLKAVPLLTDFIDIGIPADYYRFCAWIKSGRKAPL